MRQTAEADPDLRGLVASLQAALTIFGLAAAGRLTAGGGCHFTGMERIEAGRAHCALCGDVIRPGEDALTTPDFLADEADPFWRFADAAMHRACFLVWDRRKAFVARYNRAARLWVTQDGSHPGMTSEGEIVRRWGGSPPPSGSAA